jgi:hypothetical protein
MLSLEYMIRLTKACHCLFRFVTYRAQNSPQDAVDCSELVTGARLGLHRTVIDIHDTQNLEAQVLTPKTRRDRASAVQRRNVIQNAVLGRAHGMTHLL